MALEIREKAIAAVGSRHDTYHRNGRLLSEDLPAPVHRAGTGGRRLRQAGTPWANDTVTYGYSNARLRSSPSLQQPMGTWTNGLGYDATWNLTTRTNYGAPQTFGVNVKNEPTSAEVEPVPLS